MKGLEIGVAMAVAGLILAAEHYIPWEEAIRVKVHVTARYVMGLMGLLVPLTVLFAVWGSWGECLAMWLVAVFGGLTVMGAHAFDHWLRLRIRLHAAEMENNLLRPDREIEHEVDR